MSIIDYIIDSLVSFLEQYKTARVRYGVDNRAHVHTIDVLPQKLLDQDDVFDWFDDFIMDSINEFPEELVCLKNKESHLDLGTLVFDREGLLYNSISLSQERMSIDLAFTTVRTEGILQNTTITLAETSKQAPVPMKNGDIVSTQKNEYSLAA